MHLNDTDACGCAASTSVLMSLYASISLHRMPHNAVAEQILCMIPHSSSIPSDQDTMTIDGLYF